jgi:hypothetical protein
MEDSLDLSITIQILPVLFKKQRPDLPVEIFFLFFKNSINLMVGNTNANTGKFGR